MKKSLFELLKWLPGKFGNENLWLPVWMHLMDTAGIMNLLIRKWLPQHTRRIIAESDDTAAAIGVFLALTHDLGKMTPAFADSICCHVPGCREKLEEIGLMPRKTDKNTGFTHAYGSAALLYQHKCPIEIAIITASHHGLPPERTEWQKIKQFAGAFRLNCQGSGGAAALWKEAQTGWIDYALSQSGFASMNELTPLTRQAQLILCGLLEMADWIANNQEYFPFIPICENRDESLYPQRVLDAYTKAGLTEPWNSDCPIMDDARFARSFAYINPDKNILPNAVQKALIDAAEKSDGGLFILEAPMDCGKTEAALAAAERLNTKCGCGGVFFGLPTMATANGVFKRLLPWAEAASSKNKNSIALSHSMAELNETYYELINNKNDYESNLTISSWLRGSKKALLSNFVVGTIDQFLAAALDHKFFMLRHLGLAGKVVILDEIHACDAHMNAYLDRMLQWLGKYKTPVIILSATLTSARRAAMINAYRNKEGGESAEWQHTQAYPLLTWTNGEDICQSEISSDEKSHIVKIEKIDDSYLISTLKEKLKSGGCAGIIVNTVEKAQQVFAEVSDVFAEKDGYRVQLYHSCYLAPDRADREDKLVTQIGKNSTAESRDKLIVIGTQVLEQSLDIDFDILFTDLCPMDILLQRIERLHRHHRTRPESLKDPICEIIGIDDKSLKSSEDVYDSYLLKRTLDLLSDKIMLPDDTSPLVQKTYAKDENSEDFDLYAKYCEKIELLKKSGAAYCIGAPVCSNLPEFNSLIGLSFHNAGCDEMTAVRSEGQSIEVLLLGTDNAGTPILLSGEKKGTLISTADTPDTDLAREILKQKIRLPFHFSIGENYKTTISEIQLKNKDILSAWNLSPWLKDNLILLLDDHSVKLCGKILKYSDDFGLHAK